MPRKRSKIFEARRFAFVIAIAVFGICLALFSTTRILQNIEGPVLDKHFELKTVRETKAIQEGAVLSHQNLKISDSILILGIDQKTLAEYGKWPFSRTRHADLINSFSRLNDQSNRESALFMDVFFIEQDPNPTNDALLTKAIDDSGKVFIETVLSPYGTVEPDDPMEVRQRTLYDGWGSVRNVKGDWKKINAFYDYEPPLEPLGKAAAGYGHANFISDQDQIYRRQPLVLRSSVLVRTIRLDELEPGFTVDEAAFERIGWQDDKGGLHDIDLPLTLASLERLKTRMKAEAPMKVEDKDQDGTPDDSYYIVRQYRDSFVPAITLSLALQYFNRKLDDIEVVAGSHILIPSPMQRDPVSGELVPYSIQTEPEQYDKDGNLVAEGKRRIVPEIRIPINERAQMLVNFMGYRSSPTSDGVQTFPVRSFAAYANRDPGPDPDAWRRTLAVKNKVLMVGAFAAGVAEDEKPTPLGIMYGIEMHANALNTILMDNFIHQAPPWVDMAVLAAALLIIAFVSSRLPAIAGLFITIAAMAVYFFGVNLLFDSKAYLLNFSTPALASILTFVSVVVYRVFTEERDKRLIRDTFGKYLSPSVVEELATNPPELGGVDKDLTVFFSDIRGFTTLSENMTSQELVNHLNIYFSAMTDLAIQYMGTLDKYIGDAMMAFWGAPLPLQNHTELACKCALKQMRVLEELNQGWPEAKHIRIGIGINSGIMTVGNMGSKQRMNYTLMGDNVNLCSRLEATNKEYGTSIIISEFAYAHVKDKFVVRELDNIRVKGKNKPVLIYELVDCLESIEPPAKVQGKKG
ncbi:MAG: adenylate/guanylate cyclase domain-containing protein [Spirochaetae bacterium HGW-Spirochaetae-7]|jgi:adenylate cyclase|nr:MAG: adenylate/guanylate cyclase domain-containing protein [Spirochaetae bacterium HGW-Spirochaetae-7]